ncbi:hypothetical protein FRC14_000145 [Serendipita sp. 396]|nr:hypothetical protein FRC14_000145 [Serendipita sp. 396]KAG8785525.1 hypothetical protein FRC15_001210 [Serendipita sp. 397]KAG8871183.1 hypothetical protein FRC20_010897 [Serendipita sp. 405]
MIGGVVFVVFSGVSTSALFTMRVSTLYESRPKIRRFVITIFWVSAAVQVVVSAIALFIFYHCIGTISGRCAVIGAPSRGQKYIIGAGYMTAVPCEIVILVATIYHAFHTRRLVVGTSVVWPVLRRLYTDGAFWFATALSVRLFGCFQWFFFPNDLKSFSDPMLYALQSIVAVRFFLALRRQVGNSVLSTSTVVHVAPSRKLAAGLRPEHSTAQSSPPLAAMVSAVGVGRSADDQHPSTFGTGTGITPPYKSVSAHSPSHSHSRRDYSWMLPSFSTTTTPREACSTRSRSRPYSNNTFGGEDIQMASISTREYEHEATRSRSKRDEHTVHSIDTSPYDLEICRTNSEPKAIISTNVGAPL